tara:strand:+ start:759 stop:1271 length:513 start_codon:yes stop_codon:yes gene_type:complete
MAGSIAIAVVSAAFQYYGQKQQMKAADKRARAAADARAKGEALQQKREDIQASRQRRRAVAESRRFRAQAVNLAANKGAGGAIGAPGSTVPGVSGNIQSQLNFNNAFINQVTGLNQGIRSAFSEAQNIASRPITAGSTLSAIGGLGMQAAGAWLGASPGQKADFKSFFTG